MATDAEVATVQAALGDVHAAMWAYGVLSPRAGERRRLGQKSFGEHRDTRDQVMAWLVAAEEIPVGAHAGYRLPFALDDADDAAALARRLEDGLGNAFARVVGAAEDPALRALAAAALTGCGTRRVSWGGIPQTFPGLPTQK